MLPAFYKKVRFFSVCFYFYIAFLFRLFSYIFLSFFAQRLKKKKLYAIIEKK